MEDNLLVGLDEYKVLNEENPIGYCRDITTCIVMIIHTNNSSILLHVEAYKRGIEIGNFVDCMEENKDNVTHVDIFKGYETNIGNLSIIMFILHKFGVHYSIYNVFKNESNETSVGYNYNTKEDYMSTMDKGKPILTKKLVK